ncbi:Sugar_(And other) transporter family protein [Hexamita inflata]|uniref:Sugar_(And other) transporter family protein n=1 Tax=Hexamita inflata TaxID=28002 RepID=A0ABP1GEW1_9EUKA
MIATWILLVVDFFAGSNFGSSVSNLSTQIIKMYAHDKHVTTFDPETSYITSLLSVSVLIGSMVGSMSVTYLMERFGRKKVTIAASILGAVLNMLTMIPVHWIYLFSMRVLVGIPSAALTTTIPAWLSELATNQQRGIVTVSFQLFICFGIILSSLMLLVIGKNETIWWVSFLTTTVFCVISAVCCAFLPDSSKTEDLDSEPKPKQAELPWSTLFVDKRFRKVIINAFILGVAQQATGINSVIIYATQTFQKAFSDDPNDYYSPIYGSLLISCVNFASTCVALPLIERLGRRWLWFGGFAIVIVGQALLILCYATSNSTALLITASVVLLFGFEIGPGPCFFVLCGETFPECVRAKCSGLAFTMNWVVNIIVVMIFPFFKGKEWAAYTVYLCMVVIPVIVLWFTVPETKGKSLKEIEQVMIGQAAEVMGEAENLM